MLSVTNGRAQPPNGQGEETGPAPQRARSPLCPRGPIQPPEAVVAAPLYTNEVTDRERCGGDTQEEEALTGVDVDEVVTGVVVVTSARVLDVVVEVSASVVVTEAEELPPELRPGMRSARARLWAYRSWKARARR